MDRLSFSRQPAVWIAVAAAVVQLVDLFGVSLPEGTEKAVAVLITAIAGAVTWTQVRPAKHSVAEEDAFVRFGPGIHTLASPGMEVGRGVTVHGAFGYADPAKAAAKSADDLSVSGNTFHSTPIRRDEEAGS